MDFKLENHGSLFLVRALSDDCLDWLVEMTSGQWLGNGLAVEPRYINNLVMGLLDSGFVGNVERKDNS